MILKKKIIISYILLAEFLYHTFSPNDMMVTWIFHRLSITEVSSGPRFRGKIIKYLKLSAEGHVAVNNFHCFHFLSKITIFTPHHLTLFLQLCKYISLVKRKSLRVITFIQWLNFTSNLYIGWEKMAKFINFIYI